MRTQKKSILLLAAGLLLTAAFPALGQNDPLKNCKVVAKKVKANSSEVIVCNRDQLGETITIPLSTLTGELQILKLDDADAALVKETPTIIGENYILIKGSDQIPYKLFDKKTGKFLNNIGAFGQGPNEYKLIYDHQLDEKNNRIYLLPWQTKKILVYDLKGNAQEPIPMCFGAPKGNFYVDTKAGIVTVSVLPFQGAKAVIWTQNLKGELIKSVEPGHLSVVPDFSNEMGAYKDNNTYGITVFTFEPRPDSLYHYNRTTNHLDPVFTLDFKSRKMSIHGYQEIPLYFFGDVSEPKQISPNTTVTHENQFYIVNKKTLKGSFYKLENDFLGNMEIGWPNYKFSNGYFFMNMDPGNLKDGLEKVLSSNKKLSAEMKSKLTKLKDSITDNDNNYILYAKLKQ